MPDIEPRVRRTGAVVAVLALLISGCIWVERAPQRAEGPIAPQSLDGSYSFTTLEEVTGEAFGHTFFPMRGIKPNSLVRVRADSTGVTFAYESESGTAQESRIADGRWTAAGYLRDLQYENAFGAYKSKRNVLVSRTGDGSLLITDTRTDVGFTCLFLPTFQKQRGSIVLKPV
jgi:hypothetical protein